MPNTHASGLKKIAFIAMPFRIKSTDLKPGDGPEAVDFDALWERGIKPALVELGYMPLRADEQAGTVIIKDMLTALVHADLVLVDISIPNGNVYYEAGIRHAARSQGCILMSADWARPLFDLKQITQMRYPLQTNSPTESDYEDIRSTLIKSIPALANSIGPVFDLVQDADTPDEARNYLLERTSALFDFDTRLNAARISAVHGDKDPLRAMLTEQRLSQLPAFALKELIDVVKENLNWSTLVSVVDSLPESVKGDAYFQEQKALGLSMGGKLPEAVGILEEVISGDGNTCLRQGNLGGMYRRLAATNVTRLRVRYQLSAIEAYRSGMALDLNDFYCSHKLLVMLNERNRAGDDVDARAVSTILGAALERAENTGITDQWLAPTQLIHAFYLRDTLRMREYCDRVLTQSWSNWQLTGLLSDLLSLLGLQPDVDLISELENDSRNREEFCMIEICSELQSGLPLSQDILMSKVFPLMEKSGKTYRKQGAVEARLASAGEEVISVTESGEETSQHTEEGEVVVRNNTSAREMYVVDPDVFAKRYESDVPLTSDFQTYVAKGQSLAVKIDHELTATLGVGAAFYIHASWDEEQYAQEGDYFVCPLPEKREIYRVGEPEFNATYL